MARWSLMKPENKPISMTSEEAAKASKEELRELWVQLFGCKMPSRLSLEFRRLALSFELGLREDPDAAFAEEQVSRELARIYEREKEGRSLKTEQAPQKPSLTPPVGSTIVKDWGGETHRVRVLEKGFEYRDQHFRSLSAIAKAITGTNWSGNACFGLKKRAKRKQHKESA